MRRLALLTWPFAWLAAILLLKLASSESAVLTLTAESFAAAVKANPLILVEFYAPWCGHCKQLEPEYEKAAAALLGRVVLAKVDATAEVALAEQYRVEGYPTLYFFKKGEPEEYGGGRQSATIVQWVEEHSGPALTVLESEEKLQKSLSNRGAASFFVAYGTSDLKGIFTRLADAHRAMGSFFFLERRSSPAVVQVHRGFDEVIELHGPFETGDAERDRATSEKVLQFLQDELLPPFGEINEDNYEGYLSRSKEGMLWVCFHPDTFREDALQHAEVFKKVALTFKQFLVVFTDTKLYQEHVREELGCLDFPTAVLQIGNFTDEASDPKRYKTLLSGEGNLTTEALSSWVRAVLEGKVEEDDGLDDLDEDDEAAEEEEEAAAEEEEAAAASEEAAAPTQPSAQDQEL